MYTSGFDNQHGQEHQETYIPTTKWRRSGRDRRLENFDKFFEEKRGFIDRRIDWFGIISSVIFPRHSKIK